jgi:hypothetical protein
MSESDFVFYADGDAVTLRLELRDEWGNLVGADSVTVTVRKARSTQNKDWAGAVEYLAPVSFENLALGQYRYSWATSSCPAGKYVAQSSVSRGGITNIERLLVTLR